ncbi:unnamed protein product [Bursaphelenchus xylophilus]|uniref:(pine wood nematode) hypothetical protein n=1 Tax=Bursaphelenchus xylophilus TaxID=6326 RepID=A0A1I7RM19_BURXY|nr:unnamed protein product [Bursaphelenchus xylophilus]CAG9118122.1 unnamed protein product [Bursaphelenchus xylophilus]
MCAFSRACSFDPSVCSRQTLVVNSITRVAGIRRLIDSLRSYKDFNRRSIRHYYLKKMVVKTLRLDEELANTGYSTRWVLDKLEKHCDDYVAAKGDKRVVDIEANDVSDGKGYLSRVFVTEVTFHDNSSFKLAMKIPTCDILEEKFLSMEGMKEDVAKVVVENLMESHNIECDAISFVASFKDFPAPKIYYVEKMREGRESGLEGREAPGVIMMNALDGASLGVVKSVTKEQCINFALDFATLHDHVAQASEEKWRNKFNSTMHWDTGMAETGVMALQKFEKAYPELSEICGILQNLDWVKYTLYALKHRPAQLNAWTYVHGDAWTNNVMFKKNPDGSVSDQVLAYIDYQIGFEGNPIFDICRFLTICADAEIRREAEPVVLKTYHDRLTSLFAKRGEKVPYSLEDVQELYDLSFVHQTLQSALVTSFMGKEHAEQFTPEVLEAQMAKLLLRSKFNLMDAEKIWKARKLAKVCSGLVADS